MRAELMRYRNDKLPYLLCLGGLALNACYLMFLYSARGVTLVDKFGKIIGLDTMFNILFLMFAFLTAEKIKTYTLKWWIFSLVLGVLQLPRILLPINLMNAGQIDVGRMVLLLIFLLGSAAMLIATAFISKEHSTRLNAYINETEKKGA